MRRTIYRMTRREDGVTITLGYFGTQKAVLQELRICYGIGEAEGKSFIKEVKKDCVAWKDVTWQLGNKKSYEITLTKEILIN